LLSNEDIKDANKFARSFIYANISVYGESNKTFAKEIYTILKDLVPEYVEANMAIPQGYAATNCQRISRNDGIYQTNQGEAKSQAIKSAFLMALAFGVVASVAIIIIDRSDKRLRDYEVITRDFHVPILGVVPTIEMGENNTAKKGTTKQNKEEK
jgi:capsular polysaccharide biosynthesis protein